MDYTAAQLREMKEPFDKLSYPDKLKFWDEHFWGEQGFFHFHSTYGFCEIGTELERDKPEHYITIFPTNKEQTNLYNRWLLNHCLEPEHYNFEKQKEKYFKVIENNPQPKAYTEQEIEKIKLALEKQKASKRKFANGWYAGYQSAITKNEDFLSMESDEFGREVLGFAKGSCDAYFLGFLEKQLAALKNSEQPKQPETNSDGKIKFYTDKDFALLIEELLKLMPFQVNDCLDYHYSKAFIHDAMSGLNWVMALRKNLMQRFKEPEIIGKYSMIPLEGTPQQIGLAYMWERNKSSQIVIENNARINKKPEQKAAPESPLPKIEKPTLEQNKKTASKYLNFLTGCNIHKEKIMNDTDFQKLLNYTYHLIEFEALPTKIKPIPQTNISTEFLRYTFYLTHKELYGTKRIKINWIDFLHNVFKQFQNVDKKTTKTKFSVKPSLYDKDIEQMKK